MAIQTARTAEETDSLASLEERIVRAVHLVTQLRQERDSVQKAAEQEITELRGENDRLRAELDTLRAERKQVRTRIEKLLSQMDVLSGS
jgi:uncharacterized protein (DUF3084 family)